MSSLHFTRIQKTAYPIVLYYSLIHSAFTVLRYTTGNVYEGPFETKVIHFIINKEKRMCHVAAYGYEVEPIGYIFCFLDYFHTYLQGNTLPARQNSSYSCAPLLADTFVVNTSIRKTSTESILGKH